MFSAELRLFPVLLRSEQSKWFSSSVPSFIKRRLRSLLAPRFLTPFHWRCSKLGLDNFGPNPYQDRNTPMILDHLGPTPAAGRWGDSSVGPVPLPYLVALASCLSPPPRVVRSSRPLSHDCPTSEPAPLYSLTIPNNLSSGCRKLNPT